MDKENLEEKLETKIQKFKFSQKRKFHIYLIVLMRNTYPTPLNEIFSNV